MSTLEEIASRLKKIDEVHEIVARMDERQKTHDEMIQRHQAEIYGKDGILTKMAKQEIKLAVIVSGISIVVGGATAFVMDKIKGR